MAIRSGFYNSVAGDKRKYFNEDISRLIHLLINDGVFQNFENQFLVHPGNGLEVIVASGLGWFNNHWIHNDNDYVIKLGAAPIVTQYKRIDSIVIKMDDSLNVRDGKILCIQGTPSEVPSPPRLVDSEDVHYHKLADVLVGANVTSIIASNITNYVGTTTTPFITGILKTIDITTLIDQWHDQFERWNSAEQQAFLNWATNEQTAFIDWFNRMKDQLTEDAAGRLQTEVDEVRGQIHTNLLNPTIGTTTIRGVEFTSNGDGTYTANGTASDEIWFNYIGEKKPISYFGVKNDGTKYRFTGCPDGGSSTTYRCDVYTYTDETPEHLIHGYVEIGNGQTFSLGSTEVQIGFGVRVKKNAVLDNVVFKPMLTTDTSSDYDSFTEYSGGKNRLNEQVADLHEKSKDLITNLLNPTAESSTLDTLTVTANGDGTYTLNGTSGATTGTDGYIAINLIPWASNIPIGENLSKMKLVGCPIGGASKGFKLQIADKNSSTVWVDDYGDGAIFDAVDGKVTLYTLRIEVKPNKTFNNLTFKPMLTTDLDATYNDYVPYSGDGRLNENVAALFDMFHPIGYLFPTTDATFNPNTAAGWHGTWERITDCVIYAAQDNVTGGIGAIVGSNTHTLTEAELPSHSHSIPKLSGTASGGSHRHKVFWFGNSTSGFTQYDNQYAATKFHAGDNRSNEYEITRSTIEPNGSPTGLSGNLSMSVTTNASTTGTSGSGSAIDIRPRRLNSVVWRRIS